MKVFLTGGAGMLGRNINSVFKKNGIEILSPTRSELDLNDFNSVRSFISFHKPTLIINSAGLVGGIAQNIKSPYEFCFNNLQIGLNIIHSAFVEGVPNLVNISSANIYPDGKPGHFMSEKDIFSGSLNPSTEGYGLAKTCVLKLACYLSEQYGLNYKSIIPCNLYGLYDSFDPQKSHMIPAVIRRLHEAKINNTDAVEIWGDGSARREFLFAADLADFIFKVANEVAIYPQSVNVAPKQDYSILEYNEIIAGVIGYKGKFYFDETKPVGTKIKRLDTNLAERYGWKDQTPIMEGINATYQHFLENIPS
jgi:GDP-L-fucose synthase